MLQGIQLAEDNHDEGTCPRPTKHQKPFEVQTYASDFALGGVLLQKGHPVAFESRKVSEVERRYTTEKKELLAVIHCLWVWRHYLLGSKFVVKTYNATVSHFLTQLKLTSKQA